MPVATPDSAVVALTPWSENIDGAGNNLINVGYFESNATNPASVGAIRLGNTDRINFRNAGNTADSGLQGSSDGIQIRVDGNVEYNLGATEADWNGNSLSNMGGLSFNDTNTSIGQAGSDLLLDVATGGLFYLRINDVTEYTFDSAKIATNNNHVRLGSGQLQLQGGENRTIQGCNANSEIQYDVATGESHTFRVNDVDEYKFNATQADFNGNNLVNVQQLGSNGGNLPTTGFIVMGAFESIRWRNACNNSDNYIDFAADTFGISFNTVEGYGFNATQADFNGNNLINVGYYETNAANPATAGAIRLGSSEQIFSRNSLNAANSVFGFNASDVFEIGSSGAIDYRFAFNEADWNSNDLRNVGFYESNAANPAAAGAIRIGSTESIGWRNNANSADVLLAKDTNDKLTFDGHIADPVGVHDMPVPASAMWAGTTEGATGLTATEFGAAGHKITLQTFDFTSTTADERVQFRTPLPREYDNGTVDIQINWSFASGTGVVRWGARMVATGDNEAIATNFGTAVEANDTAGTADQVQQVTLSTITIGNTPADTNEIHFEIYREGSDAGDTFSGTARLHSVVVRFTTDSAVSA